RTCIEVFYTFFQNKLLLNRSSIKLVDSLFLEVLSKLYVVRYCSRIDAKLNSSYFCIWVCFGIIVKTKSRTHLLQVLTKISNKRPIKNVEGFKSSTNIATNIFWNT